MTATLSDYLSIGEIGSRLQSPIHRVHYAMVKLRIKPVAKIGGRCLYHVDDVGRIGKVIVGIDARLQRRMTRAKASVDGLGVVVASEM